MSPVQVSSLVILEGGRDENEGSGYLCTYVTIGLLTHVR